MGALTALSLVLGVLAAILCWHALGVEATVGIFLALWASNIAERALR